MSWHFLASPHGARICCNSRCAFLLRAVTTSRSLRSFSLRPAPPCLFPPDASCPRCFAPPRPQPNLVSWHPELLYHPLPNLVTHPPKRTHPTLFSLTASCSSAMGKAGGRTVNFSIFPGVLPGGGGVKKNSSKRHTVFSSAANPRRVRGRGIGKFFPYTYDQKFYQTKPLQSKNSAS